MTEYRTLLGEGRAEIEEKRSVFIGSAAFVTTEEEAVAFINRIRAEFPDARHNVYAYLLREGAKTRYSDDKEPQGTAGIPVLEVLRKNGCLDAVIVVTRYFGGILLGAGGLARAYTEAAAAAVRAAVPVLRRPAIEYTLTCSYAEYPRLCQLIERFGGAPKEPCFAADVTLSYTIPEKDADRLLAEFTEVTGGKVLPRRGKEDWEKVPV
ncbi:MAG: YigZ family protein [Clostridia bacterium]|nr:YigZ family protein [Clostridia bacterium]